MVEADETIGGMHLGCHMGKVHNDTCELIDKPPLLAMTCVTCVVNLPFDLQNKGGL